MNDHEKIVEYRLNNANDQLKQYEKYDIDTTVALAILESKQKEIRNMLKGFHRSAHYSKVVSFLLYDNPNMNRKVIDRYLAFRMFIFSHKIMWWFDTVIIPMLFVSVPTTITYMVYAYNKNNDNIIWLLMLTEFASFFGFVMICNIIISLFDD